MSTDKSNSLCGLSSLLVLSPDLLRLIISYLDIRSTIIYFSLSKRFRLLNNDDFWVTRIKNDFGQKCRKCTFDKQIHNYIASYYCKLASHTNLRDKIKEVRLKRLLSIAKMTGDKEEYAKRADELKELDDKKIGKLNRLSDFLIGILKEAHQFKAEFTNISGVEMVASEIKMKVTGRGEYHICNMLKLKLSGYKKISDDDYFILYLSRCLSSNDLKYNLIPTDRFTQFIYKLGLRMRDIGKLYDLPNIIKYDYNFG